MALDIGRNDPCQKEKRIAGPEIALQARLGVVSMRGVRMRGLKQLRWSQLPDEIEDERYNEEDAPTQKMYHYFQNAMRWRRGIKAPSCVALPRQDNPFLRQFL